MLLLPESPSRSQWSDAKLVDQHGRCLLHMEDKSAMRWPRKNLTIPGVLMQVAVEKDDGSLIEALSVNGEMVDVAQINSCR